MNDQQLILVKRLEEAGLGTKRFLKVNEKKRAFETSWQNKLYGPEDLNTYPRWGINGSDFLVLVDSDEQIMYDALNKALPPTFEVTSPRRGLPHKYFLVFGKRNKEVQNAHLHIEGVLGEDGKLKSLGEIRAQNNYLVAPGTPIRYKDLITGEEKTGVYLVTKNIPIAKVEYDDFMEAVKPFIGANPKQKLTLDQIEKGIPDGERHTRLFQEACKFAYSGISEDFIFGALRLTAQRCEPPFTNEEELKRMIRNAIQYKNENSEKVKTGLETIEQAATNAYKEFYSPPITLQEVKKTFQKWLFIDGDNEVIDVILAASKDREILGDPLWIVLISPSGGTKTELVRSLKNKNIYSLDSVTPHTFISGRVDKDEEGNPSPVIGILKEIDGKVLVIKDFTVLLGKRREDRDEIFSQLRSLYDGYIEFGFGTSSIPVRIEAKIGLIAACTPAIDSFTKMYLQLGERFLKIRHHPDAKKATHKALQNLGKEEQMREELTEATSRFLKHLKIEEIPKIPIAYSLIIEEIALSVAILRTPVPIDFWKFEINKAAEPITEYPTRLAKQLMKLAYSLAIIRRGKTVTKADIKTVKRVARDTSFPNRVKIIKAMNENPDQQFTTTNLSKETKIPLATCWRELKEMEYLALVEYEKAEGDVGSYGGKRHTPEKDGWKLLNRELSNILDSAEIPEAESELSLFTNVPPTYANENKIDGREDASEKAKKPIIKPSEDNKPTFRIKKIPPSGIAVKCDSGEFPVQFIVKPPHTEEIQRCPNCLRELRQKFSSATWKEEASN